MEWDWTWSNVTEDRRTSCSRSQLADARFSCRQSERKKTVWNKSQSTKSEQNRNT